MSDPKKYQVAGVQSNCESFKREYKAVRTQEHDKEFWELFQKKDKEFDEGYEKCYGGKCMYYREVIEKDNEKYTCIDMNMKPSNTSYDAESDWVDHLTTKKEGDTLAKSLKPKEEGTLRIIIRQIRRYYTTQQMRKQYEAVITAYTKAKSLVDTWEETFSKKNQKELWAELERASGFKDMTLAKWLADQRERKMKEWTYKGTLIDNYKEEQHWNRWRKELMYPPWHFNTRLGVPNELTALFWRMEVNFRFREKMPAHMIILGQVATTTFAESGYHYYRQLLLVKDLLEVIHLSPKIAFSQLLKKSLRDEQVQLYEKVKPLYHQLPPNTMIQEWERDQVKAGQPPLGSKDDACKKNINQEYEKVKKLNRNLQVVTKYEKVEWVYIEKAYEAEFTERVRRFTERLEQRQKKQEAVANNEQSEVELMRRFLRKRAKAVGKEVLLEKLLEERKEEGLMQFIEVIIKHEPEEVREIDPVEAWRFQKPVAGRRRDEKAFRKDTKKFLEKLEPAEVPMITN